MKVGFERFTEGRKGREGRRDKVSLRSLRSSVEKRRALGLFFVVIE